MWFRRILCICAVLFSLSGLASASPFGLSGEWRMNANGWVYKLVLLEKGDQLDGVLRPANLQSSELQMLGKVFPDGRVELSCDQSGIMQYFSGYVFQGNGAMAGLLSQQGNRQSAWFAERLGQTTQTPFVPQVPYNPQPSYPIAAPVKVFSAASMSMSGSEKAARLEVQTIFDKTPSHITAAFNGYATVYEGQKLILAGNAAGTEKWRVSEFLFLEFRSGHVVRRFIAGGGLDQIKYDGQIVEKIGARGTFHAPDEIDFAPYLPKGIPVGVTIYALHYGPGVGSVSDVYLVTK